MLYNKGCNVLEKTFYYDVLEQGFVLSNTIKAIIYLVLILFYNVCQYLICPIL